MFSLFVCLWWTLALGLVTNQLIELWHAKVSQSNSFNHGVPSGPPSVFHSTRSSQKGSFFTPYGSPPRSATERPYWVLLVGVPDKKWKICIIHCRHQAFRDKEKSFSIFLTAPYCLTTGLMAKNRDLVILVVTDRQMDKTDHFAPCACLLGSNHYSCSL